METAFKTGWTRIDRMDDESNRSGGRLASSDHARIVLIGFLQLVSFMLSSLDLYTCSESAFTFKSIADVIA